MESLNYAYKGKRHLNVGG